MISLHLSLQFKKKIKHARTQTHMHICTETERQGVEQDQQLVQSDRHAQTFLQESKNSYMQHPLSHTHLFARYFSALF